MREEDGVFQRLRARGEAVFAQLSADLLENPRFAKALQHAMKGKELFDQAAARALKTMNLPTRTEFHRALRRIEALEAEVAALKARPPRQAPKRRPAGRRTR